MISPGCGKIGDLQRESTPKNQQQLCDAACKNGPEFQSNIFNHFVE